MIEIFGLSGRGLIILGVGYIMISKIFLFISWYNLYYSLPQSIIKGDYTSVNYNMTTFRFIALYEVLVTIVYLIIGIAILEYI